MRAPLRSLALSQRRYIQTVKVPESNDRRIFRNLLDPKAITLLNKYQADIEYASYAEENRKQMHYTRRITLANKIEWEKKVAKLTEESSTVFAKFVKPQTDSEYAKRLPIAEESETEPAVATEIGDRDEDAERQEALAMAKRKILREMGFRTSAIENQGETATENWMEDYDTFDEADVTYDSHYGTPGRIGRVWQFAIHTDIGCFL